MDRAHGCHLIRRATEKPVPWKSRSPVDLRLEMVQRCLQGEPLSALAREYGISRKTAKKFKRRFLKLGEPGLVDQSRAPHFIPHKTTPELVRILLAERKKHPSWGAKKLKV